MKLILLVILSIFTIDKITLAQKKLNVSSKTQEIDLLLQKSRQNQEKKPQKSIDYSEKAYKIAKEINNKKYLMKVLNYLSHLLWTMSDYPNALDYAIEWLRYAKKSQNQKEIINALNMIGIIHDAQKNYKEALFYYKQILKLTKKNKDKVNQARVLNNIGEVYKAKRNLEKAKKYYLIALSINQNNKQPKGTAVCLNNLGEVSFEQKKYIDALNYFIKAKNIKENLTNKKSLAITLNNIAKTYQKINDTQKALIYAKKSLRVAKEGQSKLDIKLAYKTLSYIYQKRGKYKKALSYFQKYSKLKEELFLISKEERISHLEVKYKLDEHKKEIGFLEQKQYFLYTIFAILFTALSALTFLFYNRQKLRIKKNKEILRRNKALSEAREEVKQVNEALKITNTNLESKVKERTLSLKKINRQLIRSNREIDVFLYRISHDFRAPIATLQGLKKIGETHTQNTFLLDIFGKIGETLFLTENMVNKLLMVNTINHKSSKAKDKYKPVELITILNETLSQVKNQGWAFKKVYMKTNIKENFEINSDIELLEIIFENLFENAILYSKKGSEVDIEINLISSKDEYQVIVLDRGKGMSEETINNAFEMFFRGSIESRGNGLGLYVVKRAINKLNGRIVIESQLNKYTKFIINLPK